MTSTDEATIGDDVIEELRQRREQMQALIRAADAKAQALVGVHGLATAGAVALAKTSTGSVWLTGSAILVGAALIVTLTALLPRLGHARTGLTAIAKMSPADVLADVARGESPAQLAGQVVRLSRIAMRKMRAVQIAIGLLIVGALGVAVGLL